MSDPATDPQPVSEPVPAPEPIAEPPAPELTPEPEGPQSDHTAAERDKGKEWAHGMVTLFDDMITAHVRLSDKVASGFNEANAGRQMRARLYQLRDLLTEDE